ncbi:uncharacterized protein LACBIDRAFT_304916 [Laccaria bicolor S238N-H82]|uniref:Predicted protein n=1 Tax=Laccaria bicolor (strain S238N-H82 / ATCC MYA-4686) TaxID=486041 RepID=B0DMM6_LACBS|nr:uncharacterized protein LACBIDRAFT_304916 [Laccaria bicolor S238N-H82]EDR04312.1 predicted protein [Laccaria bicolor S238N-H82]|eukprot:XP_001885203.1 predicted protein [Laccaria bicolor S238N-H82]
MLHLLPTKTHPRFSLLDSSSSLCSTEDTRYRNRSRFVDALVRCKVYLTRPVPLAGLRLCVGAIVPTASALIRGVFNMSWGDRLSIQSASLMKCNEMLNT